ncbi:DUF397 domain-containing protein [Streptomyces rubrogriseus]|uniref:DUF397 domain-containing protein n=1 Tax=Streptomyces rubrogriseus TaxID=194673 RepID=UPI0036F62314
MTPNWRTSSYTETQNCVEVADNDPEHVLVRDTRCAGGECWPSSEAAGRHSSSTPRKRSAVCLPYVDREIPSCSLRKRERRSLGGRSLCSLRKRPLGPSGSG